MGRPSRHAAWKTFPSTDMYYLIEYWLLLTDATYLMQPSSRRHAWQLKTLYYDFASDAESVVGFGNSLLQPPIILSHWLGLRVLISDVQRQFGSTNNVKLPLLLTSDVVAIRVRAYCSTHILSYRPKNQVLTRYHSSLARLVPRQPPFSAHIGNSKGFMLFDC